MSGVGYAFKELIGSLDARAWAWSFAAVVGVVVLSGSLSLCSLLLEPEGTNAEFTVLAVPHADLSQTELGALYRRLETDPAVARARYLFPSEGDSAAASGRFRIALHPGHDPEDVIARLRGWGAFREVAVPSSPPPGAVRAWLLNPDNRWGVLTGFSALFGLTLLAIYMGLRAARAGLAGELDLLRLAGVEPAVVRTPFVLLGGLYGLIGAIAVLLLSISGGVWLSGPALSDDLPELAETHALTALGLRGFVLGLILSLFGAALGRLAAPAQRYPSPLRRSRISSSEVGEA